MFKVIATTLSVSLLFLGCAQKPEERQIVEKDKALNIQLEATAFANQIRAITSIAGKVKTIDNQVGNYVKKGDPIFSIDKELIEKEIKIVKGQIESGERYMNNSRYASSGNNPTIIQLARMNLEKVSTLYAQGYVSEEKYREAKSNYANALYQENQKNSGDNANYYNQRKDVEAKQLELYRLEEKLKDTTVEANMTGYIFNLDLYEGQNLGEGQKVGEIVDISSIRVRAGLATGLLPYVKEGRVATISFLTTPPINVQVPIEKVIPVMDPAFGRIAIDFTVKNNNNLIQPGTKAIVTIPVKEDEKEKVKEIFLYDEKKNSTGVIEVKSEN